MVEDPDGHMRVLFKGSSRALSGRVLEKRAGCIRREKQRRGKAGRESAVKIAGAPLGALQCLGDNDWFSIALHHRSGCRAVGGAQHADAHQFAVDRLQLADVDASGAVRDRLLLDVVQFALRTIDRRHTRPEGTARARQHPRSQRRSSR